MSRGADLSGARRKLKAFREKLPKAVDDIASHARTRIAGRANTSYFRDAGPGAGPRASNDNGPLRIVTGRLERSLRGARYKGRQEGILNVKTVPKGFRIEIGSKVPYAATHEKGFSGVVQRGDVSYTLTIPRRPYAAPSAKKERRRIVIFSRKRISKAGASL